MSLSYNIRSRSLWILTLKVLYNTNNFTDKLQELNRHILRLITNKSHNSTTAPRAQNTHHLIKRRNFQRIKRPRAFRINKQEIKLNGKQKTEKYEKPAGKDSNAPAQIENRVRNYIRGKTAMEYSPKGLRMKTRLFCIICVCVYMCIYIFVYFRVGEMCAVKICDALIGCWFVLKIGSKSKKKLL